jgi:hypothetical protein
MRKTSSSLLLVWLFALTVLVVACTTKRDGVAYRIYHNTTTHYNGHFNADQAMIKAEGKIISNTTEDYDSILSVIALGNDDAAKTAYEDLERVIEKSEKVIAKHTITGEKKGSIKWPEYNRWIDENYVLIGKAHFYKKNYNEAEKLFQFVSKKYTEPNAIGVSSSWLALDLLAQDEAPKAIQLMTREEFNPALMTAKNQVFYHSVLAQLYIYTQKWEKAKVELQHALATTKKKKERARLYFILGQVHERLEEYSAAQTQYANALNSKPTVELGFQARMKKALNALRNGSSSLIAKAELLKMLEDVKYSDYKDQILYTLAIMADEQGESAEAKQLLSRSIRESKKNKKQKGKSFLKLADLHFLGKEYVSAQAAYDSTQKYISDKHPRYEEVSGRAKSLTELVQYLNKIESADSLHKICGMSAQEQLVAIKDIRQKMIAQETARREEEARLAAERQAATLANSGTAGFWCYNKSMRDKGYEEFLKYWDDRPLKDNWRLQAKLTSMNDIPDERPGTSESAEDPSNSAENAVASEEDLLKSLPCKDQTKMQTMASERCEAYYKAGLVYKEDLNDENAALQIWETSLKKVEENLYTPLTYYQIYRTWKTVEEWGAKSKNCATCSSVYWGNEIKKKYPGSEWARFVDDPNAKDEEEKKKQEELAGYEEIYQMYAKRHYPEAMTACNKVLREDSTNHLLCKYRILRAVCVGYVDAMAGLTDQYQEALQDVINQCPGSPEAERAKELLLPFKPKTEPKPEETKPTAPLATEANYSFDENTEHYFAIEIPASTPDINSYKATVADYLQKNYASNKLTVTGNMLNTETQLLMTKSFKKLADAQDFMSTFAKNSTDLKSFNEKGFNYFLISKSNYIQLFKARNLDAYKTFYKQNYP